MVGGFKYKKHTDRFPEKVMTNPTKNHHSGWRQHYKALQKKNSK